MRRQVKKYDYLNIRLRSAARLPSHLGNVVARNIAGSITGAHTNKNIVAFTFDDGPHPEYTPHLVEILNKYNAKATFFMVGKSAEKYPEVVKYVASSGHVIANHTWDHPAVPAIDRRERFRQILACEQVLAPYGSQLFRPPYGFQSFTSYMDARLLGYRVVNWTKSVEDWLDHDADRLSVNITRVLKPGNIILMHDVLYHTLADGYADRTPLLNAIDNVLRLKSDTFNFVTVPELLQQGKTRKSSWFRQADITWLNSLSNGNGRQY